MSHEPENKFSLSAYLKADLIKFQRMSRGVDSRSSNGVLLWLGMISPRFIPILLCRLAHWFYLLRLSPLAKLVSLVNFFLFGIEIAIRCPIGPGIFFPHTQGTVIGALSIGDNVTIFQGTTLGAKEIDFSYSQDGRPVIGNNVTIGSGAKILGGIFLGDDSRIGANAVVLSNVPEGVLVIGVPARAVDVDGVS
jgi:serine O-acetyltransferase